MLRYADNQQSIPMFEKAHLVKLANTPMPFGRYKGRLIIDLPQAYLVWFSRQGFPAGELGMLMALALEADMNGLRGMIRELKELP